VTTLGSRSWGEGPLLVLCHGFTQTSGSWGEFGELLGARHRVLAVNLPGHGSSTEVEADLVEAGRLVAEAADGEPFDLLGYSLGGRTALHAALQRPTGLRRLILLSASAGIPDELQRQERRLADDALATRIEEEADLEAFLGRWLAMPMFRRLPPAAAGVDERLHNRPEGLARSLRQMGAGRQEWLGPRVRAIEVPSLLLAGALDDRYVAAATQMARTMANACLTVVPGAGHALHLEAPGRTATEVLSWLAATDHATATPSASSPPTSS